MPVKWNDAAVIARIRAAAAQGVVAATERVRGEAISLILDTPKTGRVYRRRGVTHRASAPDEPPASDTGRLVNSIRTGFDPDSIVGTVIAGTAYAGHLEFGTARMAPRPFMRPALTNTQLEIEAIIGGAIRAALADLR